MRSVLPSAPSFPLPRVPLVGGEGRRATSSFSSFSCCLLFSTAHFPAPVSSLGASWVVSPPIVSTVSGGVSLFWPRSWTSEWWTQGPTPRPTRPHGSCCPQPPRHNTFDEGGLFGPSPFPPLLSRPRRPRPLLVRPRCYHALQRPSCRRCIHLSLLLRLLLHLLNPRLSRLLLTPLPRPLSLQLRWIASDNWPTCDDASTNGIAPTTGGSARTRAAPTTAATPATASLATSEEERRFFQSCLFLLFRVCPSFFSLDLLAPVSSVPSTSSASFSSGIRLGGSVSSRPPPHSSSSTPAPRWRSGFLCVAPSTTTPDPSNLASPPFAPPGTVLKKRRPKRKRSY